MNLTPALRQRLLTAQQDVKLIALSGLVTGSAASLSMAASEYLSTGSEKTDKNPILAAVYTGTAVTSSINGWA